MSSVSFTPTVLSSYENFKQFFDSNKEADKERILNPNSKRAMITHFVNEKMIEIRQRYDLCSYIIGDLLRREYKSTPFRSVSHADLTRDCEAKRSGSDYTRVSPFTREEWLAPSNNYQRVDTTDIYEQPPIPIASITDPKVKENVDVGGLRQSFDPKTDQLNFFKYRGVCYGMSMWFAILYFETKDHFPDPPEGRIEHIKAIANLFSRGAPRAASLLQILYTDLSRSDLFNITACNHWPIYYQRTPLLGTRVDHPDELVQEIRHLSPGVYEFQLRRHSTLYIKMSKTQAFFFEPDNGTMLVDGEQGDKKLIEYILTKSGPNKGGCMLENLLLKGRILRIQKLVRRDNITISDCLESNKNVLRTFAYFFTYPLRWAYFATIQTVKAIFAKAVSLIGQIAGFLKSKAQVPVVVGCKC